MIHIWLLLGVFNQSSIEIAKDSRKQCLLTYSLPLDTLHENHSKNSLENTQVNHHCINIIISEYC